MSSNSRISNSYTTGSHPTSQLSLTQSQVTGSEDPIKSASIKNTFLTFYQKAYSKNGENHVPNEKNTALMTEAETLYQVLAGDMQSTEQVDSFFKTQFEVLDQLKSPTPKLSSTSSIKTSSSIHPEREQDNPVGPFQEKLLSFNGKAKNLEKEANALKKLKGVLAENKEGRWKSIASTTLIGGALVTLGILTLAGIIATGGTLGILLGVLGVWWGGALLLPNLLVRPFLILKDKKQCKEAIKNYKASLEDFSSKKKELLSLLKKETDSLSTEQKQKLENTLRGSYLCNFFPDTRPGNEGNTVVLNFEEMEGPSIAFFKALNARLVSDAVSIVETPEELELLKRNCTPFFERLGATDFFRKLSGTEKTDLLNAFDSRRKELEGNQPEELQ